MTERPHLLRIAVAAAGGPSAVAELLGVHPTTVSRYMSGAIKIPRKSVDAIVAAGCDVVSRRKLMAWLDRRSS